MAEFITKCPHCNAELQAQEEWIGMTVECPQCQKTFVISTPNTDNDNSYKTDSQNVKTISSTPPPFEDKTSVPVAPPPFVGKILAASEDKNLNSHIKQKLDLHIAAMAVATFLCVILFPIVLRMFISGWAVEKSTHEWVAYLLASVAFGTFYAYSGLEAYLVWECIKSVSEKRRHQNPFVSSILLLIPGWHCMWSFVVYPGIAKDLNEEIISQGKAAPTGLYGFSLAQCVINLFMCLLCFILPFLKMDVGSCIALAIMTICAIAGHLQALLVFSKTVAIIKNNDEV